MTTVRFDLHVHTHHSFDCLTRPEQLVAAVQRNGLTGIAITDHNAIEGALHLRDVAPFPVIVGEEIETTHGEVAGLFLREWIPPRLSPQETIARIKAQGGLVYVTHPLAHGVPSRIRQHVLREILPQVDLIEGFNARVPLPADDRRVRELALEHGIALGAGSDAHFAAEVGRGYVELEPFADAPGFLANLRQGRVVEVRRTPYPVSGVTYGLKWLRLAWWKVNCRPYPPCPTGR